MVISLPRSSESRLRRLSSSEGAEEIKRADAAEDPGPITDPLHTLPISLPIAAVSVPSSAATPTGFLTVQSVQSPLSTTSFSASPSSSTPSPTPTATHPPVHHDPPRKSSSAASSSATIELFPEASSTSIVDFAPSPSVTPSPSTSGSQNSTTAAQNQSSSSTSSEPKSLSMGIGIIIGVCCVLALVIPIFFAYRFWRRRKANWDTQTYSDLDRFSRFSIQSVFRLPPRARIIDDAEDGGDVLAVQSPTEMSVTSPRSVSLPSPGGQRPMTIQPPIPPPPTHSHTRSRSRNNPLPILPPLDLSRSTTMASYASGASRTTEDEHGSEIEIPRIQVTMDDSPYTGIERTPIAKMFARRRSRTSTSVAGPSNQRPSRPAPIPEESSTSSTSKPTPPPSPNITVRRSIQKDRSLFATNLTSPPPPPTPACPQYSPEPQTPNTYALGKARAEARANRFTAISAVSALPLYSARRETYGKPNRI